MSDEREVSIVIKAKNLTAEEFDKARQQIAGLKKTTDDGGKSTETFGQKLLGAKSAGALFDDQVKKIAAGFTIASLIDRAGGALVGFVGNVFETAGRVGDLASKLGTSIEFIQRMSYVAGQSGTSIDTFGSAIGNMNRLLSEGDSSTLMALGKVGLSFDSIRAMKPEDAFLTISRAISQIPDPMLQSELAVRLFGRAGAELLPAIKGDIEEVGKAARVMADDTVNNLKRTADNWKRLGDIATVAGGEAINAIFFARADAMNKDQNFWRDAMDGALAAAQKTKPLETALKSLARTLPELKAPTLDTNEYLKQQKQELDRAAEAAKQHQAQIRAMADQYRGAKLAQEIRDTVAALALISDQSKISVYELRRLSDQAAQYRDQGGKLTPQLELLAAAHGILNQKYLTGDAAVKALTATTGQYAQKVRDVVAPFSTPITMDISSILKFGAVDPKKLGVENPSQVFARAFSDNVKTTLTTSLPASIMGAIQGGGDPIAAAGSTMGVSLLGDKGLAGYITSKASQGVLSKGLASVLSSSLPIVGSMVGPAFSSLVSKLFGGGAAGRDLVKEFGAQFGGLDALHQQMLKTFDQQTAERYWISLTQGVGKNNPQQAKSIIDEITRAMADQKSEIDSLVPSWKDAVGIAEGYGGTIDQLGPLFQQQQLSDQVLKLVVDTKKLQAAHIDLTTQIEFMGDEYQDAINKALKGNLALPSKMRDVAEEMLKQGKLLDENGNKMTDLSRLTWTETLDEKIGKVIDRLDEFIAKLAGGVGAAAQTAVDQARDAFAGVSFRIPVDFDVNKEGGYTGAGGEWTGPAFASGGIAEGRQVALLAERGRREIVGDQSFMTSALVAAIQRIGGPSNISGAGGPMNFHFMIDSESGAARLSTEAEFARRVNKAMRSGIVSVPANALTRS